MLWYSLEAPRRGTSNEYPQHMFSWRNKKIFTGYPPLSRPMILSRSAVKPNNLVRALAIHCGSGPSISAYDLP